MAISDSINTFLAITSARRQQEGQQLAVRQQAEQERYGRTAQLNQAAAMIQAAPAAVRPALMQIFGTVLPETLGQGFRGLAQAAPEDLKYSVQEAARGAYTGMNGQQLSEFGLDQLTGKDAAQRAGVALDAGIADKDSVYGRTFDAQFGINANAMRQGYLNRRFQGLSTLDAATQGLVLNNPALLGRNADLLSGGITPAQREQFGLTRQGQNMQNSQYYYGANLQNRQFMSSQAQQNAQFGAAQGAEQGRFLGRLGLDELIARGNNDVRLAASRQAGQQDAATNALAVHRAQIDYSELLAKDNINAEMRSILNQGLQGTNMLLMGAQPAAPRYEGTDPLNASTVPFWAPWRR